MTTAKMGLATAFKAIDQIDTNNTSDILEQLLINLSALISYDLKVAVEEEAA